MNEIPFKTLAEQTRLSPRRLARVLRVRVDSVRSWLKGTRTAPPGVLAELRAYISGMGNA